MITSQGVLHRMHTKLRLAVSLHRVWHDCFSDEDRASARENIHEKQQQAEDGMASR